MKCKTTAVLACVCCLTVAAITGCGQTDGASGSNTGGKMGVTFPGHALTAAQWQKVGAAAALEQATHSIHHRPFNPQGYPTPTPATNAVK